MSTDTSENATARPAGGRPAGALRRRRLLALLALTTLVAGCALLSLAAGAKVIPLGQVWDALWTPTGSEDDLVVRTLRVPRALLGLGVGAALGMAGGLMQGHTRNPLAEPGLLGVSAGASFFVVVAIYVFGVTSPVGFVWFAFVGAFAATLLVFTVGSSGRDGPTPVALALAGVAVSALLTALTSAVVLTNTVTLDVYRFWAVGSIANRDLSVGLDVAPFLLTGVVMALINARALNLLSLGDDVARALGQNLSAARWTGLAAITLLAGAAVAACGPISFVGLVVPHIARRVVGADYRWLLPSSALLGSALVLLADSLGRIVVRPGELPIGIVLALVGGPFFVVLVRRRRLMSL